MPVAHTFSIALAGLDAHVIEVEADVASGLPAFVITGANDPALREGRERVRSAASNSGATWPSRRITVGLSPAGVRKVGGGFDLAIAVAVLAAAEEGPTERLDGLVLIGELGLEGAVRPVSGVLPAVLGAKQAGFTRFAVPADNAAEAALVVDDGVLPVRTLRGLLHWLETGEQADDETGDRPVGAGRPRSPVATEPPGLDLRDVVGQQRAVRALEIAAAGGHHVLMTGPPGVGKTMLAQRLPGLLPDLEPDDALQVTAIHSVAGVLPAGGRLVRRPPFCAPHHTSSTTALIGGGSPTALPGAASVAHRGVLFLDESPEFGPRSLDALRQPLESGEVIVARSGGVTRYPARFLLVLAANPCGCAVGADRRPGQFVTDCDCSAAAKRRYQARMSGPLLDRVDIRLELQQPSAGLLGEEQEGPSSAEVRERVAAARARAARRYSGSGWALNGDVPGPVLRRRWPVARDGLALLDDAQAGGRLSPRGVDRVLRLSWTMADLAGRDQPSADDVASALGLRAGGSRPGLRSTAAMRRSA